MTTKFKWPAMLAALAAAGWLAVWGDKTPADALAVVPPLAHSTERVAEAPRLHAWAPRDASAAQTWLQASTDPFRPLDAAASAVAGVATTDAPPPALAVLGRGQVESGRETVFVQVDDEIQGLQVGSQVAGLQVLAIQADALLLRHLRTHETLRIPLGSPHGVFKQESSP